MYNIKYLTQGQGTIQGDIDQAIEPGENASSVIAYADDKWRFVAWDDGNTQAWRHDLAVQASATYTAMFKRVWHYAYSYGEGGSITGDQSQDVLDGEVGTEVTAVPSLGYAFDQWSDGITSANRIDSDGYDLSVVAHFSPITYSIHVDDDPNAQVRNGEQTVNFGADSDPILCIPNLGYTFVKWSDQNTDNPRTIENVRTNISLSCVVGINTYELKYTHTVGGALEGILNQAVEFGQDGSMVSAKADPGYNFSGWSDGSVLPDRQDLDVSKDIQVVAKFTKQSSGTYNPDSCYVVPLLPSNSWMSDLTFLIGGGVLPANITNISSVAVVSVSGVGRTLYVHEGSLAPNQRLVILGTEYVVLTAVNGVCSILPELQTAVDKIDAVVINPTDDPVSATVMADVFPLNPFVVKVDADGVAGNMELAINISPSFILDDLQWNKQVITLGSNTYQIMAKNGNTLTLATALKYNYPSGIVATFLPNITLPIQGEGRFLLVEDQSFEILSESPFVVKGDLTHKILEGTTCTLFA